jgi:hypothetical protein
MTTTAEELLEEIAVEKKIDEDLLPQEEEKSEEDLSKLKQRKPPKDGPCKRCGQNKPINRLMLCYECWVKTELEKSGWREGLPHPDWCHCEGLSGHQRKSFGN